jgi:hypothetical protein
MHNNFDDADDWQSDCQNRVSEIESLIASAGSFLAVSNDFRPNVIEAAKERAADRRLCWRFFGVAVAAVFCFMIGASVSARVDPLENPSLRSIERAMNGSDIDSQYHDGREWALADAYARWRHYLASRLAGSTRSDSRETPQSE